MHHAREQSSQTEVGRSVKEELNLRHVTPAFRTFCGESALTRYPVSWRGSDAKRAVIISVPALLEHPDAMDRLYAALGDEPGR